MIINKSINKDNISQKTKINRKQAIEIILSGGNPSNKAVHNIISSVSQQDLDFICIQHKILRPYINFGEIYKSCENYGKGFIPVLISMIIKNNIDYIVIEKDGEEVDLNSSIFEDIELNPSLYTLKFISNHSQYDLYKNIFSRNDDGLNIFSNIVYAMQAWFFNLSKYTIIISKSYMGQGKFNPIKKEITEFKSSLKVLQNNPYYYISEILPQIFEIDTYAQLKGAKEYIDSTLESLRSTLVTDIYHLFPTGLKSWCKNLPEVTKQKIFENGEEYFLSLCKSDILNNELLDNIVNYIIGIPIENWNEDTPLIFYNRLTEIKSVIENSTIQNEKSKFLIRYTHDGEAEICKVLNMHDNLDKQIKDMFINDFKKLFNDYGNSISHSDKVGLALKIAMGVD